MRECINSPWCEPRERCRCENYSLNQKNNGNK